MKIILESYEDIEEFKKILGFKPTVAPLNVVKVAPVETVALAVEPTPAPTPAPAPAKRTAAKKVEPVVVAAPVVVEPVVVEPAPAVVVADDDESVTIEDLRNALREITDPKLMLQLVTDVGGATKLSHVKVENYGKLMKAIRENL